MVVLSRRLVIEERHFQPLAFGSAILEPKLYVLWFQPWEFLTVRHTVQLFGVF